ncbi:MAG: deoxyribonuclease IV [Pirellulales bacterium]
MSRRTTPLIGAHMSIAGGYERAVEAAAECGMDVVQLFTKNNNQWRGKPISDDDVTRFRDSLSRLRIRHPLSHSSYLINLGSSDETLWRKSVDALIVELQRAELLGIAYVVVHPGAAVGADESVGLDNIVRGLDEIHDSHPALKAKLALENTAGQGSCLGWRFEQLAYLLEHVRQPDRLGVCFDTCHAFAAGYPLAERKDYLATFREFDQWIGVERIVAFHLNDSKREFGSRVDRHEHIGRGHVGLEAFRHLLNDKRFRDTPMYLETPKGDHEGRSWDAINLATLRALTAS